MPTSPLLRLLLSTSELSKAQVTNLFHEDIGENIATAICPECYRPGTIAADKSPNQQYYLIVSYTKLVWHW